MDKLNERRRLLTEALANLDNEIEDLKIKNTFICVLLEFSYNQTQPKPGLAQDMMKNGFKGLEDFVNQYEIDFIDQEIPYKDTIISYYRTNNKELLKPLIVEMIPFMSNMLGIDASNIIKSTFKI